MRLHNPTNRFYCSFYINKKDNLTHFCTETEKINKVDCYDYLLDPLKIQFQLIAKDISSLDLTNSNSKKIMAINYELFHFLLNHIGDILNYEGKNTLTYIEEFISNVKHYPDEIKKSNFETNFEQELLRTAYRHISELAAFDDVLTISRQYHLEHTLPKHDNKKQNTNKI